MSGAILRVAKSASCTAPCPAPAAMAAVTLN